MEHIHPVFFLIPTPLSPSCLGASSSGQSCQDTQSDCGLSVLSGGTTARESRVLTEAALKVIHREHWAGSPQSMKQAKGKG